LCDARCPKTNRFCRKVFRHKQKEGFKCNHDFPKGIKAKDSLLLMASTHGGIVTVGSRVDRSIRAVTGPIIASTNTEAAVAARCYGCFNRKRAVIPYKKPDKLKYVLEHLVFQIIDHYYYYCDNCLCVCIVLLLLLLLLPNNVCVVLILFVVMGSIPTKHTHPDLSGTSARCSCCCCCCCIIPVTTIQSIHAAVHRLIEFVDFFFIACRWWEGRSVPYRN